MPYAVTERAHTHTRTHTHTHTHTYINTHIHTHTDTDIQVHTQHTLTHAYVHTQHTIALRTQELLTKELARKKSGRCARSLWLFLCVGFLGMHY